MSELYQSSTPVMKSEQTGKSSLTAPQQMIPVFKCEFCPEEFTIKDLLVHHVAVLHKLSHNTMESEEDPTSTSTSTIASECDTNQQEATSNVSFGKFQCDDCPEYFPVSSMLLLHKRSHKKNLCKICGKYFKRLTRHMVVHTDVRPFKCDVCDKTFKSRGCLTTHKHTHNKPFKCNMCPRAFVSDVLLAAHIA
eukprot:397560_1